MGQQSPKGNKLCVEFLLCQSKLVDKTLSLRRTVAPSVVKAPQETRPAHALAAPHLGVLTCAA